MESLSDLREYVHRRVDFPAEDEPVIRISNPDLRQEIINTLVERANGMYVFPKNWCATVLFNGFDIYRFLWVHLQILHLCDQQTDRDIRSSLLSFPKV